MLGRLKPPGKDTFRIGYDMCVQRNIWIVYLEAREITDQNKKRKRPRIFMNVQIGKATLWDMRTMRPKNVHTHSGHKRIEILKEKWAKWRHTEKRNKGKRMWRNVENQNKRLGSLAIFIFWTARSYSINLFLAGRTQCQHRPVCVAAASKVRICKRNEDLNT